MEETVSESQPPTSAHYGALIWIQLTSIGTHTRGLIAEYLTMHYHFLIFTSMQNKEATLQFTTWRRMTCMRSPLVEYMTRGQTKHSIYWPCMVSYTKWVRFTTTIWDEYDQNALRLFKLRVNKKFPNYKVRFTAAQELAYGNTETHPHPVSAKMPLLHPPPLHICTKGNSHALNWGDLLPLAQLTPESHFIQFWGTFV